MEPSKEKRKKGKIDDVEERRREKKSKRARSRSRSAGETRDKDSKRKRRTARSQSPNNPVKQEKQNERSKEGKSEPPARKAKDTDMLNTRTGGAYIPPARLRMMQAQITDKSSIAYQRLAWEALKKSIHGHINKINVGNIGIIIKQLLKENIVRGRGLLCRSVIQAQAASPTFTNVYAALVAAVNSRFPNIGELLLKRLVIQFKRGFKRNDKSICISAASFIAHLVNQKVAHEILALELLTLLVETPSDDSVEVAIAFLKECGQKLTEVSSKGVNAIFEMLRNILHEGQLDKRVQYMIEVMFQVWKDGFKDHPALLDELELVPEEEQFTHLLMLDDATDSQDILNVFKHDEKYEENEQKYKTLCKEILGSDAESEEGSGESGSDESDDEDDEEESEQKEMTIIDNTETNLVALRRTIYLTINSSLDFEECAHKLMKMQLKPGQEVELCHMFLDCCAEQRTYEKFYGLLAQRFCNLNRIYIGPFEEIFKDSYSTAHRLDTNRLRNVSKFFAHLLFTDSISWEVLECVRLNEEDTTSSSRIYIKILFQELAEYMGLKKLNDRLKDPTLQGAFLGVFPRDNPKNTRFSINFFTTIGLGGLTDELREHLKQMPKNVPPPPEINLESESSSDSSSSSSSSDSSDSSSDSNEDSSKKKKKDKKKSKKDDRDKSPKSPEVEPDKTKDTERWGHDGYYDNYGKDARRHEPANERDKDNFVIPQRPRPNERRNQKEDRSRNDKYRRNDDEERPRNQKDIERNDGSRDRESQDGRRKKGDKRRDREENDRDERSDGSESQDKDEKLYREVDKRNKKSSKEDKSEQKRDKRSKREDRGDESRDKEKEGRDNQKEGAKRDRERRRDRNNERDVRDDQREKNGRDERDDRRGDLNERTERDDRRGDRNDRNERDDRRGDRNDRIERFDRRGDRNERDENNDRRGDRNDRNERDDRRGDRNGRDERDDRRGDQIDKGERDDRRGDRIDRDERDDRRGDRNGRDERDDRRSRDKKEKHGKRSRVDKDGIRLQINGEYKQRTKGVDKDRVKKEKDVSDSDSSDSDSSTSSSSSEEDSGIRDDGWDIRGSSISKEVVGRYWEMPPDRKRETMERSPVREKRRDR